MKNLLVSITSSKYACESMVSKEDLGGDDPNLTRDKSIEILIETYL